MMNAYTLWHPEHGLKLWAIKPTASQVRKACCNDSWNKCWNDWKRDGWKVVKINVERSKRPVMSRSITEEIATAILAALGSSENPVEQMLEIVKLLDQAGYKIVRKESAPDDPTRQT